MRNESNSSQEQHLRSLTRRVQYYEQLKYTIHSTLASKQSQKDCLTNLLVLAALLAADGPELEHLEQQKLLR